MTIVWIAALVIYGAVCYTVGWYRSRWYLLDSLAGRKRK